MRIFFQTFLTVLFLSLTVGAAPDKEKIAKETIDVPIKSFEALKKGTPLLTQFSLLSLSVENTW